MNAVAGKYLLNALNFSGFMRLLTLLDLMHTRKVDFFAPQNRKSGS